MLSNKSRVFPLLSSAVLLAALSLPTAATASEADSTGPAARWSFHWGDPAPLPDGRAGWTHPEFPASFTPGPANVEPPGRQGRNLVWIALPVPQLSLESPGVFFGNASAGAVEVYFDGARIYASGEIRPGKTERSFRAGGHLIPLPREALGRQVLVRLQASTTVALSNVEFGDRGALFARLVRRALFPWLVAALSVAVGLIAWLAWLRARRQLALLGLGLFSVSTGLLIFAIEDVRPLLLGDSHLWFLVQMSVAFFGSPGLCLFVAVGVLTERKRWFDRLVKLEVAAALLSSAALFLGASLSAALLPWLPVGMGGMIAAIVVSAMEARKNVEARIFVVGIATLVSCALLESSSAFGGGETYKTMPFGLIVLLGAGSLVMARRFVELLRTTEHQVQLLKSREDDVRLLSEQLGRGAEQLTAAVSGLREATTAQADIVNRQGTAIAETQVTATEIGQTSSVADERARAVLQAAEQASLAGRRGGEALAETLSGLDSVRLEVDEMARRVAELGDKTREIDDIVASVKDLADQSQMLAFNAGLEAARAGQEGRGFAVVAREIRSLAEQSVGFTARIRASMRTIHQGVQDAVTLSAGGSNRVEQIVAQARRSGEELRQFVDIASQTGAGAHEIATAVSQQHAGVGEILQALAELTEQANRSMQAMAEAEKAADNVQRVASELLQAAAHGPGEAASAPTTATAAR